MSSPRAAVAKAARRARAPAKLTTRSGKAALAAVKDGNDGGSAQAKRLAAAMERALAQGERNLISRDALQSLMAVVCRTYAAQVEAGEELLPLPPRGGATATDVMITASGLLKSANLAVFELGMWQSCTGR